MKTKILNIDAIINAAQKVTGKSSKAIKSPTRLASVVAARNLCYKIAKERLYLADRDIALSFNRDRSAVTYSLKRVDSDLETQKNYRLTLEAIERILGL
jgi:chromosomal replication initiation ATPase DnaA